MEQEPQKDTIAPEPSTTPPTVEPSVPKLRPEDEALVVERLRELGYIE